MSDTHVTAPTQYIEVDGDRFAYRRWGKPSGVPIFLVQHFRGGMDHWDPLLTDGLAEGREVILFNGRGIASSSGTPRNRIEDMADDIAAVIRALGLEQVDLLGFSIGGYQVQEVALRHPQLVRKLLLLGTGLRGGDPTSDPKVPDHALNPVHDRWRTSSSCSSAARKPRSKRAGPSGSDVTSGPTRTRRARPRSHRRSSKRSWPMRNRCRARIPMPT